MGNTPYRAPSGELGPLVRRHRSPAPVQPIILILVVFGLPGVALLTGVRSEPGQVFAGDRATNAALGAAFLAGAIACVIGLVRKSTLSVAVHEGGLYWTERGLRRKVSWTDIVGVRARLVSRLVQGVEVSRSQVFRLQLEDGRELVATHMLNDVVALVEHVERKLEARLLPAMRRALEAGETVTFGPIRLTSDGLAVSDHVVEWSQLAVVEVDDGTIFVRLKDGRAREVESSKVTNARLLLALVEEREGVAGASR